MMKTSTRRFTIFGAVFGDPYLSQFRGLHYLLRLRSRLTRDSLINNGNPRSGRCETCSQFYVKQYRRHNNSPNNKLGCFNVALLRNYACQIKEFRLRIRMHYQDCQESYYVLNCFESLPIQKVRMPPLMSQMNKALRPLRVATTLDPHLIVTILCWKAMLEKNIFMFSSSIFSITSILVK